MLPYREAAEVEAEPAKVPTTEERLGELRSVHAAPSLQKALFAPALIGGGMVPFLVFVAQFPVAFTLAFSSALLLLLAMLGLAPTALRRESVVLHAHGLVLERRGKRTAIIFEDIDEVWFEIPLLHTSHGATLRAMRLVGFDKQTHHVPLVLLGAAALSRAILQECSGPLLAQATSALAAGETLTFGRVQMTRNEITIEGDSAPWSKLRLARVQPARVAFFRRLPLLPWRIVRLDRIPNPTIFCALVARCAKEVCRDGTLTMELVNTVDIGAIASATADPQKTALRNMAIGGLTFMVGLIVSLVGVTTGRSHFVLALGPIIWGALRFVQGFKAWR